MIIHFTRKAAKADKRLRKVFIRWGGFTLSWGIS